jgi:NADH dehydrogenase
MKKIIIVGGGFAGVVTARKLSKQPNVSITLVSNSKDFRFNATLYRVATGYKRNIAIIPLQDILPEKINLIIHPAKQISLKNQTITLDTNVKLNYDIAILALGVETSYFGIPGLAKLSYGIKDVPSLNKLHKHLHDDLVKQKHLDKNYVVVGGGPTGVELSSNLGTYLKRIMKSHNIKKQTVRIKLIESAPRILPGLKPSASKKVTSRLKKLGVRVMTNSKVEAETPTTLKTDKESIPTHTTIWTAGTKNNAFFDDNAPEFKFSKRHKIEVDEYLRIGKNTYVIGDNAETKYSGLAQTAIHQALYVSKNIKKEIQKKPTKKYRPKRPTYIVPVGDSWAILQYGLFATAGKIASIIRFFADIIGYGETMGLIKSIKVWRDYKKDNQCHACTHDDGQD